jgi:sterol desaturase/sphingolipid hydroxylase (fatty acid hydroxylase superfamily)
MTDASERQHGHEAHEHHVEDGNVNAMAASATLHCLTGCAIGEITGLIIATAVGLGTVAAIALAVALAFLFGYSFSTLPLLRAGRTFGAALSIVLAADTLSILTMEVVDNAVMAAIPGAMNAGLVNVVFWIGMLIALTAAFLAAYPVNRVLLKRGKGHALTHQYHHATSTPTGWRRRIPALSTGALAAVIVAFMSGAVVVAAAAELGVGNGGEPGPHGFTARVDATADRDR